MIEPKTFRTVPNNPGADNFFRSLPMTQLLEDGKTKARPRKTTKRTQTGKDLEKVYENKSQKRA